LDKINFFGEILDKIDDKVVYETKILIYDKYI